MSVDDWLVKAAVDQAWQHWPDRGRVAAAVRVEGGAALTGVPLANFKRGDVALR